jgi:hypothetical protein
LTFDVYKPPLGKYIMSRNSIHPDDIINNFFVTHRVVSTKATLYSTFHSSRKDMRFAKQGFAEFAIALRRSTSQAVPEYIATESSISTPSSNRVKGILRKAMSIDKIIRKDAYGNKIDYSTKGYKVSFASEGAESYLQEKKVHKKKACVCVIF